MNFLKLIRSIFLPCATLLLLAACSRAPQTGPVEIKFDRDTCKHCSMAISDRHFAVEVRGGPKNELFKFDDYGCAMTWLKQQPWANDPATLIWVADFHDGKWLNARTAHYIGGKTTPMAYGYGATLEPQSGSIGFDEALKLVLDKNK
jgi:copper chaperone NosL